MSGDGAYFSAEYDHVVRVAGQLTEVSDALDTAVCGAGGLRAVASPGFTSVGAALDCAEACLAQVRWLAGRVDTASANLAGAVSTYQATDAGAAGSLHTVDAGMAG